MDASVSSIAATATQLATQKSSDQVNTLMLQKALKIQATTAAGLLQTIQPPIKAAPLTSSVGHNIDTTA